MEIMGPANHGRCRAGPARPAETAEGIGNDLARQADVLDRQRGPLTSDETAVLGTLIRYGEIRESETAALHELINAGLVHRDEQTGGHAVATDVHYSLGYLTYPLTDDEPPGAAGHADPDDLPALTDTEWDPLIAYAADDLG